MTDPAATDEAIRACQRCGHRDWAIVRQPDCLNAECNFCGVAYDIGWRTDGYVA